MHLWYPLFLSVSNIGIGLVLFQSPACGPVSLSRTGDYIILFYIGYVVFTVIWEVILYVVFTVIALTAPFDGQPMNHNGGVACSLFLSLQIGRSLLLACCVRSSVMITSAIRG